MDMQRLIVIAGLIAALCFLSPDFWGGMDSIGRQLRNLGAGRMLQIRLDPSKVSDIDDRRGEQHGDDDEADGGWLGQPGPEPGDSGRGRTVACWDTLARRRVDLSFCDREHGRRR